MLKILVDLRATDERKSNWEILSNLGFPMAPLVMSLREFPPNEKEIPELINRFI